MNDNLRIEALQIIADEPDVVIPVEEGNLPPRVHLRQRRPPHDVQKVELHSVDLQPVQEVGAGKGLLARLAGKAEDDMRADTDPDSTEPGDGIHKIGDG